MKTRILFTILMMSGLMGYAQIPNYVPTDGLVGWYPFNGNANDESGNGNNGTVNGATLTQDRFGVTNAAYSFDGVNDLISIEDNPDFTNGSISASIWIRNDAMSSFNPSRYILNKGCVQPFTTSSTDVSFRLYFQDDGITSEFVFDTWTPVRQYVNGPSEASNWTHVVIAYNGSEIRFYHNGILFSSNPQTGNISDDEFPIYIGARLINTNCEDGSFYSGLLDDIGFWNRALTEEEIQGLYNAGICYDHVTVTDTLVINFNMTGFNPVTYEHSIEIYPNPTSDHITINYGDFVGLNGYTLSIFNPMGQLVHTSNITQQQEYLDLNSWGGMGVYQVVVYNPQGVPIETRQIVLQ